MFECKGSVAIFCTSEGVAIQVLVKKRKRVTGKYYKD